MTGSGNLTIAGTAQVFLNTATANASSGFTGNVIIASGGHLQQRTSAANPLGTVATITVDAGGALQADTGATSPLTLPNNLVMDGGTVQLQNPGLMTYTGSVTINGGFNSTFDTSGTTSQIKLAENLLGSGSATEAGNPVVMLAGNNSSFAGTWIATGTAGTQFTNAAAGSSGALWVTNAGAYTANITGGGTLNMGALSGSTGTVSNGLAGTTETFASPGHQHDVRRRVHQRQRHDGPHEGRRGEPGPHRHLQLYRVDHRQRRHAATRQPGHDPDQRGRQHRTGEQFHGRLCQRGYSVLHKPDFRQRHGGLCRPRQCFARRFPGLHGRHGRAGGHALRGSPAGPTAMQLNFNGNSLDSSGNNNNATLVNSPAYTMGFLPASQALSLNGSNQYATVPHSTSLNLTGAYTVSLWEEGTLASATTASTGGPALSVPATAKTIISTSR